MLNKFVLIFILIGIVSAVDIQNPALVSSIQGTVTDSGKIYAINGDFISLELNDSIPQSIDNQQVSYAGSTITDTEGNTYANLKSSNPPNPFSYSVVSSILVTDRKTTDLPVTYAVPIDYDVYTAPALEVQSNSPEIIQLAKSITANSADDFERVAKLAIWVHTNVKYNINLVGEEKDALSVLQSKEGVCVEYSTLFAALARSLGIPTKFVTGYAYSEFNTWLGHQWTEVYIGKWIPVDPTWLEVGNLDATHIELLKSYKRDQPDWVYAYMSDPNAQIQWEKDLKFGGEANAVNITSITLANPPDYELKTTASTLNFGDKAIVFLKVHGNDYRVVDAQLLSCAGDPQIVMQNETEKDIILKPNEDRIIPWVLQINPSLSTRYEYTCPLTFYSSYLGNNSVNIEAVPTPLQKTTFNSWLSKDSLSLGDMEEVFYQPTSVAPGSEIGYLSDYSEQAVQVSSNAAGSFSFTPKSLGLNEVYVYSNTGQVDELQFSVLQSVNLSIKNVSIQAYAVLGGNISVNVTIENKASAAVRVKVSAAMDNNQEDQLTDLAGEKTIQFELPTNETGTRNITITAEAGDITLDQKSVTDVFSIPVVQVDKVDYGYNGNKTTVIIYLKTSNDPKNMKIMVDDYTVNAKEGMNEIELDPGNYTIAVQWQDMAGNNYSLEQNLVVPKENLLNSINLPCWPLFILLATILLARRNL